MKNKEWTHPDNYILKNHIMHKKMCCIKNKIYIIDKKKGLITFKVRPYSSILFISACSETNSNAFLL